MPLPAALRRELCEVLAVEMDGDASGCAAPGNDLHGEEEWSVWYRGRRVLVTGAGGSVGSALCRHLLHLRPSRLILLERDEHNLFEALRQLEPEARRSGVELAGVLGDLRHAARVDSAFRRHAPDVVLHAAACKHVSLLEDNVAEAVSINIGGTRVLLDACASYGIERCLLVSTDKAVEPASLMGATKRLNELMFQTRRRMDGRDRYRCARLGNVLGSRGSVVPIFREQILQGGPVTLTDPRMTRYFIGLREAARRIVAAAAVASPAALFVVEMGKPVRVLDLARAMIGLLAGASAVEIRTVGCRPGERLHERLLQAEERVVGTLDSGLLAVDAPVENGSLRLPELERAAAEGDDEAVRELLAQLPIGYRPAAAILPPCSAAERDF